MSRSRIDDGKRSKARRCRVSSAVTNRALSRLARARYRQSCKGCFSWIESSEASSRSSVSWLSSTTFRANAWCHSRNASFVSSAFNWLFRNFRVIALATSTRNNSGAKSCSSVERSFRASTLPDSATIHLTAMLASTTVNLAPHDPRVFQACYLAAHRTYAGADPETP
jgi:hypothetical protein